MPNKTIDLAEPPADATPVLLRGAAPPRSAWPLRLVLIYVAAVLGVDAAATASWEWPFDWSIFQWSPLSMHPWAQALQKAAGLPNGATRWLTARWVQSFDCFKFVWWLLVPVLCSVWRFDWRAMGVGRWKPHDKYWLGGILLVGIAAAFIVPRTPALADFVYHDLPRPGGDRAGAFWRELPRLCSWAIGFEFLLRYFLLHRLQQHWPRCGWLLAPLAEGLYWLHAPSFWIVGRVALSVLLTRWTLRRRNLLLPILARFLIELCLIILLLQR